MPAHPHVRAWIARNYQKPAIDQEWLADCSDWISSELGLDPNSDFDSFIQHVEAQLLQSNLEDSTVSGSGIDPLLVAPHPPHRPTTRRPVRQAPPRKATGPTPLLVEIRSITEIAHSAFNLLNTHQTRLDRADLGLAREEDAEQHPDEDEGPVPRFPRGMLRFELSDGLTTFRAIEFRSIPQLELGTTPLGYKMLLKSAPIRNGIVFLEPANVVLKGYRTEDHDANSEQVFLSSLRKRLGRPDPSPDVPIVDQARANQPAQPPPAQPARQHELPSVAQPPPPPPGIDEMYVDDEVDPDVLREMTLQMDKAIDMQEKPRPGIRHPSHARPVSTSKEKHALSSTPKPTLGLHTAIAPSSPKGPSTGSSVKTSSYFSAHASDSKQVPDIGLSPRPVPPPNLEPDFDITWDVDDTNSFELPARAHDPTSVQIRQVVPSEKRPSSPDSYDDFPLDMDVNESFFEQVGMIEQGALGGVGASDKGKGKDTSAKGTTSHGRPNPAPAGKMPASSALGTKHLALYPMSPSRAESTTRMPSSTKRAASTSSLSGSAETPAPQSTQSSNHGLPRDPSLIVISSEDEAPGGSHGSARPLDLARRRKRKRKGIKLADVADSDVIDISD